VSLDGVKRTFEAGAVVEIGRGESITMPPRLYHSFWGKAGTGTVLIGEVSSVNDDTVDNKFVEHVVRFDAIEEDEPPLHLLYQDYAKFLNVPSITRTERKKK